MIRKIILSSVLLAVAGCSHIYGERGIIKNRDTDYLSAQSTPPLKIPAGYSSSTIQAHYPISDRNYTRNQQRIDLTPPELQAAPQPKPKATPSQPVAQAAPQAPVAHKQRYLSDAVAHPEYIAQSFVPSNKPAAAQNNSATSTTQPKEVASTTTPQHEAVKNQTNAAPVQQAENTTPVKKKKYIADYLR